MQDDEKEIQSVANKLETVIEENKFELRNISRGNPANPSGTSCAIEDVLFLNDSLDIKNII